MKNKLATKIVYVVYILPIVLSVIFGSVVLADVLQEPGRELNMWPGGSESKTLHDESIEIIGLDRQYTTASPIEIQVKISDPLYDCGDLYIRITSLETDTVITQSGFFEQCFDQTMLLPVGENFSEMVDIPGQYELFVEIKSKNQLNSITASEKFTIK